MRKNIIIILIFLLFSFNLINAEVINFSVTINEDTPAPTPSSSGSGGSGGFREIVPITNITQEIEILERETLFDINLNIPKKDVFIGDNLMFLVDLTNLGIPGRVNATLYYEIKDRRGLVVYGKTEIVPIETQTEFIKEIDISTFKQGEYSLLIDLKYKGQKEPAQAKEIFNIIEKEVVKEFIEERGFLIFVIFISIIILIISSILYAKLTKRRRRKKVSHY